MNEPWRCPQCGTWMAQWVQEHRCSIGVATGANQPAQNKRMCGYRRFYVFPFHWDDPCDTLIDIDGVNQYCAAHMLEYEGLIRSAGLDKKTETK